MRKLYPLVLLLIAAAACAQTVTFTASKFGGTQLYTGYITITPTWCPGPASFRLSTGGQVLTTPRRLYVSNGILTTTLPDTAAASPANAGFNIAADGGLGPGYSCVQTAQNNSWCSSGVCNFDNYVPNVASIAPQPPYVQGINSTTGELTFTGSGVSQSGNTFTFSGGGSGSMTWPTFTGLAKYGGSSNWVTPTFADVAALWALGSCSGLLKSDGTCILTSSFDAAGAAAAAQTAAEAASDPAGAAATAQSNAEAYASNASNISSGTLNHARLPALLSGDIPNNAANTSGNAATCSALATTGGNGTFWGVAGGLQGYYTPSGSGTVNSGSAYSPAFYPSGGGAAVVGTTPFTGLAYWSASAAPAAATSAQVQAVIGSGVYAPSGASTSANGQTCALGSTCNVNSGAAAHSVALNEGAGSAIGGAAIGTAGRILVDQGAGADPLFESMSQDCTLTLAGVITCTKTNGSSFAASATTDATNAANISSGTLPAARLPSQYKTWNLGDGIANNAALATSGWPAMATPENASGSTYTITAIKCYTDNAGSTTIAVTDGSGDNLLSGSTCTCSSTYASCTQSGTYTTIANGGYIKWTPTPDGTTKTITVQFSGTY